MRMLLLMLFTLSCSAPAETPPLGDAPPEPVSPDPAPPEVTPGVGEVPAVELALPESGFQVTTIGEWLEPGTDVEYCEVVQLPGSPDETFSVSRIEVAMHQFSHHVIVKAAVPGSETEAAMVVGEREPCIRPQQPFGGDMVDVTGAQKPYYSSDWPAGVGRIYHGGQKLVVDWHYYNPTTEPIPARHAINFHVAAPDAVQHVAETFGFYNYAIAVEAGETGATATECTFDKDVLIWSLTRHTHQWGRDVHVWHAGGQHDGEHLWTSTDWAHDLDYFFEDGPMLIKAGEGFGFQCEYENTEDHTLNFGVKASDEMCILFGDIWSPTGEDVSDQSCFGAPVPVRTF